MQYLDLFSKYSVLDFLAKIVLSFWKTGLDIILRPKLLLPVGDPIRVTGSSQQACVGLSSYVIKLALAVTFRCQCDCQQRLSFVISKNSYGQLPFFLSAHTGSLKRHLFTITKVKITFIGRLWKYILAWYIIVKVYELVCYSSNENFWLAHVLFTVNLAWLGDGCYINKSFWNKFVRYIYIYFS